MTIKKRKIGNTNLEITELGMGTAPIGGWPIEVSENDATILLSPAYASFDQFKNYEMRGNRFKELVNSLGEIY